MVLSPVVHYLKPGHPIHLCPREKEPQQWGFVLTWYKREEVE